MTHWGQVGAELQGPHWQQGSWGIPWQTQPLAHGARRSSSCGIAGTEAEICCCNPAELQPKPYLRSGGDRRRGLSTNCTW